MVRQRFTVSGGDRGVMAVSVRLKRTFGSDPLVLHLESGDGTPIETMEVPAGDVPVAEPGCTRGGADWVTAPLAEPRLLEEGRTYDLRLSTAPASQYTAFTIRSAFAIGAGSKNSRPFLSECGIG